MLHVLVSQAGHRAHSTAPSLAWAGPALLTAPPTSRAATAEEPPEALQVEVLSQATRSSRTVVATAAAYGARRWQWQALLAATVAASSADAARRCGRFRPRAQHRRRGLKGAFVAGAETRGGRPVRQPTAVVLRASEGVEVSDALGKPLEGRAILVGYDPGRQERKPDEPPWSPEESLEELTVLCKSLDLDIKDRILQQWRKDRGRLPIGRGKIEEIRQQVQEDGDVGVVVFDKDLDYKQMMTLKGRIDPDGQVVIIDRTSLILRIFSNRARTKEAKLQVTLASQQYMLPRLRYFLTTGAGMEARGGSAAGSSQGGSAGAALKGKGETQLNMDRTMLRRQMAGVRRKIEEVRHHRERQREDHHERGMPIIALVGYTNAGKSMLLNRLYGSVEASSANRLFETLDPTKRCVKFDSGREAMLVDTVGFIQRLPEQLVAGFRATLEELSEATVLVHVVDISSATVAQQVGTVMKTLQRLRGFDTKTPQILVFNKIDKLPGGIAPALEQELSFPWPGVVGHCQISAMSGQGLDALSEAIEGALVKHTAFGAQRLKVLIPYTESAFYSKIRGPPPLGMIEHEDHTAEGYLVDVVTTPDGARQLRKFEAPAEA